MTLRTSTLGLTLIKAFEGCQLKPYKCPAGIWTIGYGHTTAAGGTKCPVVNALTPPLKSQAAALAILMDDVDRFENQIEPWVAGQTLTEEQFDALVSFAFNAGPSSLKTSTLLKKVQAGEFAAVPAQFMRWNKAKVKGVSTEVPGLTRRRRAEAALWRGDLEDAGTYAGMDFGPMPQQVEAPVPPKATAQTGTGGATVTSGLAGVGLAVHAAIEKVDSATAPITRITSSVQAVTSKLQTASEQGQQAVTSTRQTVATTRQIVQQVQTVTPHLSTMDTLTIAAPWLLVAVVIACACGYIWHSRHRLLHEEGV